MTNAMTINEMMSFEALDKISGGTNIECKELKNAIPKVNGFFGKRKPNEKEVCQWLDKNLGIVATLHDGFILDPSDDAGDSNLYKLNSTGKYISHEETMAKIQGIVNR